MAILGFSACTQDLPTAVRNGDLDTVRRLLSEGAYPDELDRRLNAGLHYAAANCDLVAAELLLKAGSNIYMENGSCATPLVIAGLSGCRSFVDLVEARQHESFKRGSRDAFAWQLASRTIESEWAFGVRARTQLLRRPCIFSEGKGPPGLGAGPGVISLP